MTDNIIEVKESPLSKEDLARDYVDIKQAAQILNNVSTRTAYRYIDKLSKERSVTVKAIDIVSNGGVKKLYKKFDIEVLANVLNKGRMVIHYETVKERRSEPAPIIQNHVERLSMTARETASEGVALAVKYWQRPPTARFYFGTQFIGISVIVGTLLVGAHYFLTAQNKLIEAQFEALRAEIQTTGLIQKIEAEQKFFDLER